VDVHLEPEATVRDLLRGLPEANPALANHILTPEGELAAHFRLIVGGQHIDFLQGLDTAVNERDEIMLIPPLAGG